jgi:hypothetical protein
VVVSHATPIGSSAPLDAYNLGAIVGGSHATHSSTLPTSTTSNTYTTAEKTTLPSVTATMPITSSPAHTQTTTSTTSAPAAIAETAKNAGVGEASATPEAQGILAQASAYGAGALGAITAVVGNAVGAVEHATGVEIIHHNPVCPRT